MKLFTIATYDPEILPVFLEYYNKKLKVDEFFIVVNNEYFKKIYAES